MPEVRYEAIWHPCHFETPLRVHFGAPISKYPHLVVLAGGSSTPPPPPPPSRARISVVIASLVVFFAAVESKPSFLSR